MAWEHTKRWCRIIFYHKPIRAGKQRGYELEMHHLQIFCRHVFILFSILYGGFLFLSFVWYAGVSGCSYPATRYHLGHFCLVPFDGTHTEVPWYLNLWDSPSGSHNHSNQIIASRIESIMTSPLQVRDIELALRRQLSKLKEADTNKGPDEPLQDLGKLQLFASYCVLSLLDVLDTDRFSIYQND